ncbi:TetR/AcrR family transcriptional regulator [Streptomyces sp. NPDC058232]|uniref:TetR/AcrR family transcriptional regulator n=1 Tax=unclassified Streptomyces TaxID=2593676 RepID=UPI0036EA57FB
MPSTTPRRTATTGRPLSAEADILAATQRLLVNGANFTELGVQQISTEAGVARSSFYVHFRDKIDLLIRLATQLMAPTFDATSAWRPSDGLERLADTFLHIVTFYRQHASVRRALTEVAAYDASVRDFWGREITQFSDWTIAVLRAEQDAGRTSADMDPVSAAQVIVTGGERAIVEHVTARDPGSDAAFARELARIWWYGVYRRPTDHNT